MTDPRPKRRWFQYSLRTLLLLVLLVSLPLSWLATKIQQKKAERRAVAEIERLGGEVEYDYEWGIAPLPPGATWEVSRPGPAWVRKLLGDDFFSDVVCVMCGFNDELTDDGLEHLKDLTQLQRLNLCGTNITDAGYEKLKQALPDCRILHY